MLNRFKKVGIGLSFLALPLMASAAEDGLVGILKNIMGVLTMLIPLIITLGLVLFLWGIIKYVTAKGSEDRAGAIKTIVTGIIVLFVMVSVWALVGIFGETIGVAPGSDGIDTEGLRVNN